MDNETHLKSESLNIEAGFPLVLYPGYFWQYNLYSEDQCQTIAKIIVNVDGEWFDFYPYEMPKIISWPTHWTNIRYYTEYTQSTTSTTTTTTTNPLPSPSSVINLSPYPFIPLTGVIVVLVLSRKNNN